MNTTLLKPVLLGGAVAAGVIGINYMTMEKLDRLHVADAKLPHAPPGPPWTETAPQEGLRTLPVYSAFANAFGILFGMGFLAMSAEASGIGKVACAAIGAGLLTGVGASVGVGVVRGLSK